MEYFTRWGKRELLHINSHEPFAHDYFFILRKYNRVMYKKWGCRPANYCQPFFNKSQNNYFLKKGNNKLNLCKIEHKLNFDNS